MTRSFESEPESFAISVQPALSLSVDCQEWYNTTAGDTTRRSISSVHITDTGRWRQFPVPARQAGDRSAIPADSSASQPVREFLAGRANSINFWI